MGLSDEKENPSLPAMPYGFPTSSQRSLNYCKFFFSLTQEVVIMIHRLY